MKTLGWKLWAAVTIPIVLILVVELASMGLQQHNQSTILEREKNDTTAIISTVSKVDRYTFTQYLSGYWTSADGIIRMNFLGPDSITLPRQKPISVKIIAEDFGSGNLEFSILGKPTEIGWVRKIWNSDAISLTMPGKKQIYLYPYVSLKKSTTLKMKVN